MKSERTYSWEQESNRFHDIGVDKSSVRLSKMDSDSYITGYGSALYHKGKPAHDLESVRRTKIMQDIDNVKERM